MLRKRTKADNPRLVEGEIQFESVRGAISAEVSNNQYGVPNNPPTVTFYCVRGIPGRKAQTATFDAEALDAFIEHLIELRKNLPGVAHEVIYGKPTNLKPMPLLDVVKLKEGDKVYLWWAKDGNLHDVRCDETFTVEGVTPTTYPGGRSGLSFSVGGGDLFVSDEDVSRFPDSNQVDWASRGDVFFYYPPEEG